jgi:hypothetical protein
MRSARWLDHSVGTPLVANLFTRLPPAHGLLLGPTGCGKTVTAALWALRLLREGVTVAVIDARGVNGAGSGVGRGHSPYADLVTVAAHQDIPTRDYPRTATPGPLSTHGLTLYRGNPYHWRAVWGAADASMPSRADYHQTAASVLRSVLDQRAQTYDARTSPPLVVIVDHYDADVDGDVVGSSIHTLLDASRALRMGVWFVSELGYADLPLVPVLARLFQESRVVAIWRQDGRSADAMRRDGLLRTDAEWHHLVTYPPLGQCLITLDDQAACFGDVGARTPEERRICPWW